MAAQMVSRASDVRIREINLSQYITSNSTTLPAIVVISKQGSTDPKRFTSAAAFVDEYGPPNPQISMTVQSALNYFAEGSDLWAVRAVVEDPTTLYSCMVLHPASDEDPHLHLTSIGLTNPITANPNLLPDAPWAIFYPKRGPGSYAENLQITLEPLMPEIIVDYVEMQDRVLQESFTSTGVKYSVSAITNYGDTSVLGTGKWTSFDANNDADHAYKVTWQKTNGALGYKIYRSPGPNSPANEMVLIGTVGPNKNIFVDLNTVTAVSEIPQSDPVDLNEVRVIITQYSDDDTQILKQEEFICTTTPKLSSAGVQLQMDEQINLYSDLVNVRMLPDALEFTENSLASATSEWFSGGDSGPPPTSYDVAEAYEKFLNRELYKINLVINGGIADPITQAAIISLCERRGDCTGILDTPAAYQKWDRSIEYRNVVLNKNTTYAGLFNPDLLQADTTNSIQVYTPPSGWVAALCARTDRIANQAFSIAGLNRGVVNGAIKQRYVFDDGQATAMFQAQVNYFRTLTGQGIALWEQQLLTSEKSSLQWFSVRRILNVIKTSLYDYLIYALQEMNSDQIKRAISNTLNAYGTSLVQAQALSTMQVDMSGNTAQTFNAGVLVVRVILIPMIPIHEIQLEIVISKAGVSFNEVINSLNGS